MNIDHLGTGTNGARVPQVTDAPAFVSFRQVLSTFVFGSLTQDALKGQGDCALTRVPKAVVGAISNSLARCLAKLALLIKRS